MSTGAAVLAGVVIFWSVARSSAARAEPTGPEASSPVVSPVDAHPGAAAPMLAAPRLPATTFAPTSQAPARRVSIAHKWWFWTALGAAAVSVVLAGIVLAPKEPYSGNASPGVVTAF